MSVLPVLFTAEERPRALTIWVTANSIGIPLGPIVGGWLLDHFWWGSVFLINVPVVLIGLVAVAVLLPESRNPQRHARSTSSAWLLSSVGLVGITYGVIEGGENGWAEPLMLAHPGRRRRGHRRVRGVAAPHRATRWSTCACSARRGFTVGRRRRHARDVRACSACCSRCRSTSRRCSGADALGTGLRLLPVIGGLLVGARLADRLAPRIGAPDPDRRRLRAARRRAAARRHHGGRRRLRLRRDLAGRRRRRPRLRAAARRWTPRSARCRPSAAASARRC